MITRSTARRAAGAAVVVVAAVVALGNMRGLLRAQARDGGLGRANVVVFGATPAG